MQGKDKANHSPPLIQLNKSIVNNVFINITNNPMCVFFGGGWGYARKVEFLHYTEICIYKVIKTCTRKLTMSEHMICPVNHHFLPFWGQNCEGVS